MKSVSVENAASVVLNRIKNGTSSSGFIFISFLFFCLHRCRCCRLPFFSFLFGSCCYSFGFFFLSFSFIITIYLRYLLHSQANYNYVILPHVLGLSNEGAENVECQTPKTAEQHKSRRKRAQKKHEQDRTFAVP